MPIGATIGAAVIGGGASLLASSKATKASEEATAANNALQSQIYQQNSSNLQPYIQQGNAANSALNEWLGLSSGSTSGSAGGQDWSAYLQAYPDVAAEYEQEAAMGTMAAMGISSPEEFAQWHYQNYGQAEGRQVSTTAATQTQPAQTGEEQLQATVGERPTYERTEYEARPEYTRTEYEPLDVGIDQYVQSPDYEFQQERGMDALKSDKTLSGALRSGAATKSALEFSQNLALGDYDQWRSYATNQYNTDRSRSDQIYESDRTYGSDVYAADRARSDGIYADDRAYGTSVYDADRNYATSRTDTQTNALMGLAGQGLSAANGLAGVGTSYANATSANNNTAATTTANAALSAAGTVNALAGDLAYAYGRKGSSYGSSTNALNYSGLSGLY